MINTLKSVLQWASGGEKTEQLIFAQFRELLTKVPLLYLILLINSLSLSYTHYGVAPDYLTLYVTALLSVACIARAVKWHNYRHKTFTLEQAQHQIKATVLFSVLVGIGFSLWSFALIRLWRYRLKSPCCLLYVDHCVWHYCVFNSSACSRLVDHAYRGFAICIIFWHKWAPRFYCYSD